MLDVGPILRLPARRFRTWEMYDEIDPIGYVRGDYQTASIVQTLANIHRGKNQQAYKLRDFLLTFEPVPEVKRTQTLEQQFGMLQVLAAMHASDGAQGPDLTPPKVAEQMSVLPSEIKQKVEAAMRG